MHTRRTFLKDATIAGAALASAPYLLGQSRGQKYRTVLVGTGWWGGNILGEAMASGECKITALCDVDERYLLPMQARVKKESGDNPKLYRDYRELFAKEEVDIAIIATPDHWHPLQTIEAVKAGAHVYVEKPIGHTAMEGRAMVNAARAANRVVQVGTHRRIAPHNVSGYEFIKAGNLGKVGMVRSFVHYGGGPEKPTPNTEPPKELDWDMWCGPAPLRHYCEALPGTGGRPIHPKGFRHYLDYANGMLGDWGVHWLDQIVWILGEKYPKHVYSTGGRPIAGPAIYNEKEQTTDAPDHQVATYEFENFTASWEHRRFAGNHAEKGENVGCYFYGTEGTFHMGWREGWTFYPNNKNQPVVHRGAQLNEPNSQNIRELWADLLHCIKSGDKPVCDIEEIHYSTNLSLLGMLSFKLGRGIEWDGQKERIVGDKDANKLLYRDYRGEWEYPKV
ncbi:Gfo/Idh/MocA family oxidoreductase [Opitutia bacterium ISCC 51]|nr:Gfo/Idh/MocA family oxidoreductase [Opitutae bacterium ISCC 51]QXD27523.1 Gfo/Idh/MocA family oxidoreductase [Opitutae bacterium ISCC 52]